MDWENIAGKKNMLIALGAVLAVIGAYFVLEGFLPASLPELNSQTSLIIVFIIGVLTSFHCIAMCGSFVVSYSAKDAEGKKQDSGVVSHVEYNLGRLFSYTLIGAAFGLLGSIIVFTPQLRGMAGIIAGLFMIVYGLGLLGFSPFRSVSLPIPKSLTRFVVSNKKKGPFIAGLMNGFMIACGPLQAMYVFAASTGSILGGATIMFVFALGTIPVMFLFGFFVSMVSSKMSGGILKLSGALVILLGILMLNTGFALAGISLPISPEALSIGGNSVLGGNTVIGGNTGSSLNAGSQLNNAVGSLPAFQEVKMEVNAYGYSPSTLYIKQGIPVKWKINVTKLTSCNNEILVPALGISRKLVSGEQVIEFTPDKLGAIQFSCWMGMIRGSFVVEPNAAGSAAGTVGKSASPQQYYSQNQNLPKGCGCGGSRSGSGSCGS